MKSLGVFGRTTEVEQIRELLTSRGIPTYQLGGFKAGARGPLFVCINEQYEDALAVLKNPEHVVANPVDVAQFWHTAQTQGLGTVLKGSIAMLMFLLAIVGLLVAIHFYA